MYIYFIAKQSFSYFFFNKNTFSCYFNVNSTQEINKTYFLTIIYKNIRYVKVFFLVLCLKTYQSYYILVETILILLPIYFLYFFTEKNHVKPKKLINGHFTHNPRAKTTKLPLKFSVLLWLFLRESYFSARLAETE